MATLKNLSVAHLWAVFIGLGIVDSVQAATFYGEAQLLGNGSVRSFVELDDDGNPSEIGIALTQGALSLPTGDANPDIVTELSLPPEASATAFNDVELIYRPRNYPGVPEVFGVPRFSFNAFLLTPQERTLICPNPDTTAPVPRCVGEELARATKTPQPGVLPEDLFLDATLVEAGRGSYSSDPDIAFPIVQGQQPFNSAYYYGSYDGRATLIGATVSKAFLETQTNVTNPIKIPTSYPEDGYYPTTYSVTYDAPNQEHRISLGGLTYREAPEPSPILGLLALGAWGAVFKVKNKLQNKP